MSTLTCKKATQLTRDTVWKGRKTEAELYGRALMAMEAADCVALDITRLQRVDLNQAQIRLLETGRKPATVNRIMSAFGTVLQTARDAGLTVVSPPKPLREGGQEPVAFTEAEIITLFAGWLSPLARLARFLLGSGLRIGEALDLRWKDLRTEDGEVTALSVVRAKSDRVDWIPSGAAVSSALAEEAKESDVELDRIGVEALPEHDDPVFDLDYREFLAAWALHVKACLGRYDGRQNGPHALRRTFATRLHRKGVSLVLIQRLLGHANVKTTTRYIGVSPEELRKAVEL